MVEADGCPSCGYLSVCSRRLGREGAASGAQKCHGLRVVAQRARWGVRRMRGVWAVPSTASELRDRPSTRHGMTDMETGRAAQVGPGTRPLLRWAGGKRWLVPLLLPHIAVNSRVVEPFAGSASLFFGVDSTRGWLNDVNAELIMFYETVREDPDEFTRKLALLTHGEGEYYSMRASAPKDKTDRAVRFFYLNRNCFNGIYRVNKQGGFNVPYGFRRPWTPTSDEVKSAASRLAVADLTTLDYNAVLDGLRADDLLFIDPPYAASTSNETRFARYDSSGFTWSSQKRLAHRLREMWNESWSIIVCNAHDSCVLKLLADLGEPVILQRNSLVGAKRSSRHRLREVLYTNIDGLRQDLEGRVSE